MFAIAYACKWSICHMKVKFAFLNSIILEFFFVDQPHGFIRKDLKYFICKFNKAFFYLVQASRAWYACIDLYLRLAD